MRVAALPLDKGRHHGAVFAIAEADEPGTGVIQIMLPERSLDVVVNSGVHRCDDKGRRRHRSSLFFVSAVETEFPAVAGTWLLGTDAAPCGAEGRSPAFSQRRTTSSLRPRRSNAGLSDAILSGLGTWRGRFDWREGADKAQARRLRGPLWTGYMQAVMATRLEVAEMPLGSRTSHRCSLWSTRRRMLAGPGG